MSIDAILAVAIATLPREEQPAAWRRAAEWAAARGDYWHVGLWAAELAALAAGPGSVADRVRALLIATAGR